MKDHEIVITIRDTSNNVLKVENIPARSAGATIYIHTAELARLRAIEAAAKDFMQEFLSDEHCPNCSCVLPAHEEDCKAGELAVLVNA
jgi:hypothetical protein